MTKGELSPWTIGHCHLSDGQKDNGQIASILPQCAGGLCSRPLPTTAPFRFDLATNRTLKGFPRDDRLEGSKRVDEPAQRGLERLLQGQAA